MATATLPKPKTKKKTKPKAGSTNFRGQTIAYVLSGKIKEHCQDVPKVIQADTMLTEPDVPIIIQCIPKVIDTGDIYNKKLIPEHTNEVVNALSKTHKLIRHENAIEIPDYMTYKVRIEFVEP